MSSEEEGLFGVVPLRRWRWLPMRGDKTVNDLAAQFEVSPSRVVLKMKARLKERIEEIFQDERTLKKKSEGEATPEELFEQIGRLKYENDWFYCRHFIFSAPSPVCLRETGLFLAAQRKNSSEIGIKKSAKA